MEHGADELAMQINVTRTFSEGSGTTWITSVRQNDPLERINAVSDKMMAAIERQETWARISSIDNEIVAHSKQHAQIIFTIKSMELKHGDFSRVNVDVRNAYNQSKEGLLRIDTLIDTLKSEQKRLREGLG
jgi:aspartokinase